MTQSTTKSSAKQNDQRSQVEPLSTDLQLVLRTRQAQLLVRGRNVQGKPLITGLVGFADRMRLIWQAAEEDDPYADWWLVKIHEGLTVAEERIGLEVEAMREILRSTRTFRIAPTDVKEPFRMTLRFSTPYAYRLARSLGEFDELSCLAFTARKIGLIDSDRCHESIRSTARRLRSALNRPAMYRRLGLMRGKGLEVSESFKRARDLMGALPADILNGTRRAPLAPRILGSKARDIPPVVSETAEDVVFD